jgi:hypothetical protein
MRVFLDEDYVLPVCCLCGKPDKRSRVKIHRDSLYFLKRYVCPECEPEASAGEPGDYVSDYIEQMETRQGVSHEQR